MDKKPTIWISDSRTVSYDKTSDRFIIGGDVFTFQDIIDMTVLRDEIKMSRRSRAEDRRSARRGGSFR